MSGYNFTNNYENIKSWEFKPDLNTNFANSNSKEQFINFLKSYPSLVELFKTQKILFIPSLVILTGVAILEIYSLVPIINIKRLEKTHFIYEDSVNQLNSINKDREEKFNILKKHSSLLSNPSPAYLFAYYLQSSMPKNLQLTDYLVDNGGFRLNAISDNPDTIRKFISLLLENKIIDKETIKIERIINQGISNESFTLQQEIPKESISIEINGKLNFLPLEERIKSHKSSEDFGNFRKLSDYLNLINLIR